MSLTAESFVFLKLSADPMITEICGDNGVFPGIQLPDQQTPYVNYSRSKTNRTQLLAGKGSEEAVMLVEVWADTMAAEFDPLCSAIIGDLDIGKPADGVEQGAFLEDFRWASKEIKDNSGNTKMVLHGSLYFNVWGPQITAAPIVPVVTAITGLGPGNVVSHGTIFTITGSGFTCARAVNVGSIGATFEIVSDTQIAATAPAQAAGTYAVHVTVINDNGQSATSAKDLVIY